MSRKQSEESSHRRKARQNKRLEHSALSRFKDLFQRGILTHHLLRRSQNMDGIVDTDTKNNGRHENRERIQFAVEKCRKRKRRNTSVKHGESHENRTFHASKEEHRKENNQDKAYTEGEYGIVRHFIHFLEAFVSSIHSKAHR